VLLAACGSSGGDGDAAATTTTEAAAAAQAAPSTTEAEEATTDADAGAEAEADVDADEAGEDYQALVEDMDATIDDESSARDAAAAENDLDAAIEGIGELRDKLFAFDEELRDLEVPDDAVEAINAVLEADGAYIEVLDEYAAITEISEYNELLDPEEGARDDWEDAVNAAAEELDVDGVEEGLNGEGQGGVTEGDGTEDEGAEEETDVASNEGVSAGETISSGSWSMEVPEGFTGSEVGGILSMTGPNDSVLGLYTVTPQGGATTLEDVAKNSIEGGAAKNGYEITGGPETAQVGSYEGVSYYYVYDGGTAGIDIYFQADDGDFYLVSLDGADTDMEVLSTALAEVLPTVAMAG
ncbi:MAG TPA: hypothetical protein VHK88_07105, partial [Aquihabitans sp.]|nr:hypothetical protein [Aquihabitans sp.]